MYLKRGLIILIVLLSFVNVFAQECLTEPKETAETVLELCNKLYDEDCDLRKAKSVADSLPSEINKGEVKRELEILMGSSRALFTSNELIEIIICGGFEHNNNWYDLKDYELSEEGFNDEGEQLFEILIEHLSCIPCNQGAAGKIATGAQPCCVNEESTPSENIHQELANLERPYWRLKHQEGEIFSRGTFLDKNVGSKLLKKEGYGTLRKISSFEGNEEVEAIYGSSKVNVPLMIVPKETISGLLEIDVDKDLKYFLIGDSLSGYYGSEIGSGRRTSEHYIDRGSNNIIRIPAGSYLIPEDYNPRIRISDIDNFKEIFDGYDDNERSEPRSGNIIRDNDDTYVQNLRVLNNEQRKIMKVPNGAINYNGYSYAELKTASNGFEAGWYAIPKYELTEIGEPKQEKRTWNWNTNNMERLQQALDPEESLLSETWDCVTSPIDCWSDIGELTPSR